MVCQMGGSVGAQLVVDCQGELDLLMSSTTGAFAADPCTSRAHPIFQGSIAKSTVLSADVTRYREAC